MIPAFMRKKIIISPEYITDIFFILKREVYEELFTYPKKIRDNLGEGTWIFGSRIEQGNPPAFEECLKQFCSGRHDPLRLEKTGFTYNNMIIMSNPTNKKLVFIPEVYEDLLDIGENFEHDERKSLGNPPPVLNIYRGGVQVGMIQSTRVELPDFVRFYE